MRLVVNQGSHTRATRGKYLALSYCWGSKEDAAKQLKTTKASLCKNLKEITMESLPKTVSDAVLVCRAMRVRYLWVDALCIIQDDQSDWESESAKMAEIYENAYFTLCALQGNSCQSGFLTQPQRHLIKVPFQSSLNPSISGFFYIYHVTGYYDEEYDQSLLEGYPKHPAPLEVLDLALSKKPAFDCDLKESQWNTRGWTLQEALCSPRQLLFGTRMVHMLVVQLRRSQDMSFDNLSEPWGQNFQIPIIPHGWRDMIQGYSARHFSYPRDKMPALSALARKFASQIKGQYLAGIWSNELGTDLLWAPQGIRTIKAFLMPPKEYWAPSWTWACQSNPVSWPRVSRLKPEFQIASMGTATGADPYGKVQSGFLSLRTKAFVIHSSTKVVYSPGKISLGNVDFPYELTSADGEYIAYLRFDWTDHVSNDDNVVEARREIAQLSMILISTYDCQSDQPDFHDLDGSWHTLGLLVLPTEASGNYRRAGIFLSGSRQLGGPKLWDGIDTTTITLV
ncbi:hypothetical protein AnigIFM60653_001332 [Aspergillus niger]|nr:hypothetical protein AnigIFM60653_001332 [Aspergillus niger]